MDRGRIEGKILQVLTAIPQGVLYSIPDWSRLLNEDARETRRALGDLESRGEIQTVRSEAGRSDKPLYKLRTGE